MYFIDNFNHNIYKAVGGESPQLQDVGSALGSLYWARENYWEVPWQYTETEKRNGIRLYYDPKYRDVYFTPGRDKLGREAICFSEQLGQFTSFMNYEGAVMFPHESKFYSIANSYKDKKMCLWENFPEDSNEYNIIFDNPVDYSISFIDNPYSNYLKVFDTLEIQADNYNESILQGHGVNGSEDLPTHLKFPGKPFNFIKAANEYQEAYSKLTDANFKRKYRKWRAMIPRQTNRARIRNFWANITLGYKQPEEGEPYKGLSILHSVTVNYTA